MKLRDYTSARVSLGSTGGSLPTKPLLDLRLAHARARDAIHFPLDTFSLTQEMAQRNWPFLLLESMARTREEYLLRPGTGRTLNDASVAELAGFNAPRPFAFVIADGLSALAVHRHSLPLLDQVFHNLNSAPDTAHPLAIVQQGRVAIGDHIGSLLSADLAIVLIGERPGLSSPDSLGVYLTWRPQPGRTDAQRNCISNIHNHGLSYEVAAHKLVFLMREALRRKLTGIALKETAGRLLTT